jgi:hypothetical protein
MREPTRRTLTKLLRFGMSCLTLAACNAEYDGTEEHGGSEQAYLTVTKTFQESVSAYTGATDATIRRAARTTNDGFAATCEADGDHHSSLDKSCLLRWALTEVPADATITSARITLRVTNGSANTYGLYSLSRSWTESQVAWNEAAQNNAWATPGALGATDRGSLVGSVTGSAGSKTIDLNAAGVATVQSWVSNANANNGVIVASSSSTDGIDFASSQHGTPAYRPKLSFTYTTGSGVGGTGGSATAARLAGR